MSEKLSKSNKRNVKALTPSELDTALRRMTTRRLNELEEETGTRDFTDNPDLFEFSARDIAQFTKTDFDCAVELLRASPLSVKHSFDTKVIMPRAELKKRLHAFAR